LSSISLIFFFFNLYWIIPTIVTKHVELITYSFTTSPGRQMAGLLEESKLGLTQPWGSELGNNDFKETLFDK
jgi:hypothetical protein